ncbi:MAG TPA: ABC transporter ATP-binding protein [Aeromicrobium sp.]|nr:ABC transporter ATP-binding protein [Aeromicrobium sp.]
MTEPAVQISALEVSRGSKAVIDRLDLRLEPGSVTGLLGPSGCGKTTLIRAIAGVQKIAGGSVTVLGSPAGSPQNRHRVAYVTQASSVYPDLTVTQNLEYFASLYRRDSTAVNEALETVDLHDDGHQLTGSLSGGQRARVSLAAALLAKPALYLLDEPTVGLDPVLRRDLWALFGRLAASGAALLISSHVMDEADRCDRVLLMRAGQLIADASPAGLREQTHTDTIEQAFLALAEQETR